MRGRELPPWEGPVCEDCSSILVEPGFCASCRRHRADGHMPRMTYVYSDNGAARFPNGYCHGHGPNGRDNLPQGIMNESPAPEEDVLTREEHGWWLTVGKRV